MPPAAPGAHQARVRDPRKPRPRRRRSPHPLHPAQPGGTAPQSSGQRCAALAARRRRRGPGSGHTASELLMGQQPSKEVARLEAIAKDVNLLLLVIKKEIEI